MMPLMRTTTRLGWVWLPDQTEPVVPAFYREAASKIVFIRSANVLAPPEAIPLYEHGLPTAERTLARHGGVEHAERVHSRCGSAHGPPYHQPSKIRSGKAECLIRVPSMSSPICWKSEFLRPIGARDFRCLRGFRGRKEQRFSLRAL